MAFAHTLSAIQLTWQEANDDMESRKPIGPSRQWVDAGGTWQLVLVGATKGDICQVVCCRSPKRVHFRKRKDGTLRIGLGIICPKCESRRWRANNPVKAVFQSIKDRARNRGQIFTITIADLEQLIEGSNYIAKRGRTPTALHIDRKEPSLGYVAGNLQILTASANTSKRHTHDYI